MTVMNCFPDEVTKSSTRMRFPSGVKARSKSSTKGMLSLFFVSFSVCFSVGFSVAFSVAFLVSFFVSSVSDSVASVVAFLLSSAAYAGSTAMSIAARIPSIAVTTLVLIFFFLRFNHFSKAGIRKILASLP